MAGADYFLRAVDLYDRKEARNADLAYRESRDQVNDARNVANDARVQESHDANMAIAEENQTFTRAQRDAATRYIDSIRKGPGTDTVNTETLNTEVIDLLNPEEPGTTLLPTDNGDYQVVQTFEDGSIQPHTTDSGQQVTIPAMLANTAFSVSNNQGVDETRAFIQNNGGLTLNQETGNMEFLGAPEIGVDSYVAPTPGQVESVARPEIGAFGRAMEGLIPGYDAHKDFTTNLGVLQHAVVGEGSVTPSDESLRVINASLPEGEKETRASLIEKRLAKLNEDTSRPIQQVVPEPEPTVTTDEEFEAASAKAKKSISKREATNAEELTKNSANFEATPATKQRTQETVDNGGVGAYSEAQRRNIAADGLQSGLLNPQQAMNFIETGDMGKSAADLEALGIKDAQKYAKEMVKLETAHAKAQAEANKTGRMSIGDIEKLSKQYADANGIDAKDIQSRARLQTRLENTIATTMLGTELFGDVTGRVVMRQAMQAQQAIEKQAGVNSSDTFSIGLATVARGLTPDYLRTKEGQSEAKEIVAEYNGLVGNKGAPLDEGLYAALTAYNTLQPEVQERLSANQGFAQMQQLFSQYQSGDITLAQFAEATRN